MLEREIMHLGTTLAPTGPLAFQRITQGISGGQVVVPSNDVVHRGTGWACSKESGTALDHRRTGGSAGWRPTQTPLRGGNPSRGYPDLMAKGEFRKKYSGAVILYAT